MNDLEQFRAALQAPDPSLRPLDIPSIMKAGARVRRRRRLFICTGSGLAVLALLVGGNQLVEVTRPPTSPGAEVGAPGPATASPTSRPPGTPTPQPPTATTSPTEMAPPPGTRPPEPTSPPSNGDPAPPSDTLGDIVATGVKAGDGEWVISMIPVDLESLPDTTVGIRASRRLPSGTVVGGYVSNETEGPDRADGFHAASGSQNIDGVDMPAFGYYVGPATRITGRADGRTVRAKQRVWSENPDVMIFWFDLTLVDPDTDLGQLTAYDKAGRTLPAGNSTIAVG